MTRIYLPSSSPDDWKQFLAEPEKQWKTGYSAKAIAHSWQEADGFPAEVFKILTSAHPFKAIEPLIIIPEHQVPLPGGQAASQNDVWVLAKAASGLVSIAVEGKVSEPFGQTVGEWFQDPSKGKKARMKFLCETLGLSEPVPDPVRYQLLHRTASALIEAKRFCASHAVMLVHSFSQTDEWFDDYAAFLKLFNLEARHDGLVSEGERSGIALHFAWVRGNKKYLAV